MIISASRRYSSMVTEARTLTSSAPVENICASPIEMRVVIVRVAKLPLLLLDQGLQLSFPDLLSFHLLVYPLLAFFFHCVCHPLLIKKNTEGIFHPCQAVAVTTAALPSAPESSPF
jgi:hypothetical protein